MYRAISPGHCLQSDRLHPAVPVSHGVRVDSPEVVRYHRDRQGHEENAKNSAQCGEDAPEPRTRNHLAVTGAGHRAQAEPEAERYVRYYRRVVAFPSTNKHKKAYSLLRPTKTVCRRDVVNDWNFVGCWWSDRKTENACRASKVV